MASRMGLIGCLIVVVALLNGATAQVTAAGAYQVGDSLGWTVPPNTSYYTNWASSKTFFLGNALIFNATSGTHTVAIVSEADYNACTKVASYFQVQPCCPFQYTPESPGTYYIICTVSNHCEQGQKFSFTVESQSFIVESPAGSPTESPSNSASSLTVGALYAVLTATVISFLTFF